MITAILYGADGTDQLLIFSQVILSIQLSFAVFPLIWFTNDRSKMGEHVNSPLLKTLAYIVGISIAVLNAWLLLQIFRG
jgi:manganese transport protein